MTEPLLTAEERRDWETYLDQFRRELYPLFASRAISHDTAVLVWYVNRLTNTLVRLADAMEDPDEGAEWRPHG